MAHDRHKVTFAAIRRLRLLLRATKVLGSLFLLGNIDDLGNKIAGMSLRIADQRTTHQNPNGVAIFMEVALFKNTRWNSTLQHEPNPFRAAGPVVGMGNLLKTF